MDMGKRLAKNSYLFILLMIIAVITAAGYWFVEQQAQITREDMGHELATIADLKASQIVSWRRERLIEANSVYSNAAKRMHTFDGKFVKQLVYILLSLDFQRIMFCQMSR